MSVIKQVLYLYEWDQIFLEGVHLSDATAHALASSLTEQQIMTIKVFQSGIEIQTNSYVGRIKVGHLQIHVQSKMNGIE